MRRIANHKIKPDDPKKRGVTCPICHSVALKLYSDIPDRFLTTKKKYAIFYCRRCNFGITFPHPDKDKIGKSYPKNYLHQSTLSFFEKWYRKNQYRYDLGLLNKIIGKKIRGSYLDIGCGSGERMQFMKESGFKKVVGLDKYDYMMNRQKENVLNVEIKKFIPDNKFQVVGMFHVLEHLPDFLLLLKHIKKSLLLRGGYIVIQVPNFGSSERVCFRKRWFCFDVPRHLWHFSEESIRKIVKNMDLDLVGIYKTNAPLHPVSFVPSLIPSFDVQKIWVLYSKTKIKSILFKYGWIIMTVIFLPINFILNFFDTNSMLTVIIKNSHNKQLS